MTPEEYVKTYLPEAKKVEAKKGFHHHIPLTQGALEGAWGAKVKGFNFFGIKAKASTPPEKRQLITTTEYLKSPSAKFPKILSITKDKTTGLYRYSVQDWFMKYDSAAEAFEEHINFFLENPRYKEALKFKMDPDRFFEEIAKAGYATAPNYADQLKAVRKSVIKRLPK
jgi:flagellum-specific peptidoglycan hydrolase FlgJ